MNYKPSVSSPSSENKEWSGARKKVLYAESHRKTMEFPSAHCMKQRYCTRTRSCTKVLSYENIRKYSILSYESTKVRKYLRRYFRKFRTFESTTLHVHVRVHVGLHVQCNARMNVC